LLLFHVAHGILPIKYTSHDYWGIKNNLKKED